MVRLYLCSILLHGFRELIVNVPRETRNNGSLYLHLYVLPRRHKVSEWSHVKGALNRIYTTIRLTHYQIPASSTYQLLSGKLII